MNLTPAQSSALELLAQAGDRGAVTGADTLEPASERGEWSVAASPARALERKGLVRSEFRYADEAQRARRGGSTQRRVWITAAGLELLGQAPEVEAIEPGDRVAVLDGLPRTMGRPLAVVVRVNPTTATLRLLVDGSEHRIALDSIELRAKAAQVRELEVETEGELELARTPELELEEQAPAPELPRQTCRGCLEAGRARTVGTLPSGETRPYTTDELEDGRRFHYCGDCRPLELEQVAGPVVVIPCGGAKADHPAPARELYVGTYFAAMLRTALELTTPDRVRVLSGRYGLVGLEDELEPYAQRIDEPGAITPAEVAAQVAADPVLAEASVVVVLAGQAYAARAAAAFAEANPLAELELPFAGTRGIGEQLGRAAAIRRHGLERANPADMSRRAMAEELLELEAVERTPEEAARFVGYWARRGRLELERTLDRRRHIVDRRLRRLEPAR